MYGYLGAVRAKASVGPKQQKCLAAGGSWEGPTGAKKCVMPGGVVPTGATGGALPKPGSTVTGPIPSQFVGTEKQGAAGPKQVACQKQGGHWIGPEGRRWCQMVPGTVPALPVPMDTGLVDTGTVPPVTQPVTGGPSAGPEWLTGGSAGTPADTMAPGLQTGVTGAPDGAILQASATAGGPMSKNTVMLLVIAGLGALAFWQYSKGKQTGQRALGVVRRARARRRR